MMTFCGLLLGLAGAVLAYLSSGRQSLLVQPLPHGTAIAAVVLAASLAAWIGGAGVGAGIVAAIGTWMLAWVVLPYLAWWRTVWRGAAR